MTEPQMYMSKGQKVPMPSHFKHQQQQICLSAEKCYKSKSEWPKAGFTLFRSVVCPRDVSAVKSLMVNIFFTVLVIMKDHLKLHMKLYVEF